MSEIYPRHSSCVWTPSSTLGCSKEPSRFGTVEANCSGGRRSKWTLWPPHLWSWRQTSSLNAITDQKNLNSQTFGVSSLTSITNIHPNINVKKFRPTKCMLTLLTHYVVFKINPLYASLHYFFLLRFGCGLGPTKLNVKTINVIIWPYVNDL